MYIFFTVYDRSWVFQHSKALKNLVWPLWICSLNTAQWSKTCNCKLAIGVNARVNSCLLLCVSPVTDWLPVHAVPVLHDSWDRLQLIPISLVIKQTLKWSVVSVCLAQLCSTSAHSRGLLVLACRGSSITCPNTILSLFLTVKKALGVIFQNGCLLSFSSPHKNN